MVGLSDRGLGACTFLTVYTDTLVLTGFDTDTRMIIMGSESNIRHAFHTLVKICNVIYHHAQAQPDKIITWVLMI